MVMEKLKAKMELIFMCSGMGKRGLDTKTMGIVTSSLIVRTSVPH